MKFSTGIIFSSHSRYQKKFAKNLIECLIALERSLNNYCKRVSSRNVETLNLCVFSMLLPNYVFAFVLEHSLTS